LFKEKDDEIQILVESVQKNFKDISETRKRSRSVDPAVTTRDKLKNSNPRQTVEEDYISQTKTVEKDGQEKTTQKRRRASSMSNVSILSHSLLNACNMKNFDLMETRRPSCALGSCCKFILSSLVRSNWKINRQTPCW
jgi:hypothetical protein